MDGVKRNTHKMRLLLRSLARNESTTVSNKTLKNDIKEIDDEDIDTATIADYLNILDRLFIIDNQKLFLLKYVHLSESNNQKNDIFVILL